VPENIEAAGPDGERVRAEVGRLAYEINVQQYACAGLNFGTYYDRSPIIAYDGAEQPAYTMASYTPSTVPGCRTPHLWREDGGSLYDAMGAEFTLLRFDSAVDVAALDRAARQLSNEVQRRAFALAFLGVDLRTQGRLAGFVGHDHGPAPAGPLLELAREIVDQREAEDALHVELDSDHYVTLREPELLAGVLLDFLNQK